MNPSSITSYVWNRILQTFDGNIEKSTAWLARQTDEKAIWRYLLECEGIVGYDFYLHQLHQHLFHPHEVN
jgi:hypothetical protein